MQTDENIMLSGKGKLVAAENIAAEDGQRRLVDRLVIVGNAGEDEAEDVISDLRLLLRQHIQRLAERKQRHACRPDGRAAGKLSDGFDRFAQLLFRQQAQKPSQIRRDEARDLLLPGFQLARQVDADLVDLVDEQIGGHRKQRVARRLTHGKMLADAEQIGKCSAVWNAVSGCVRTYSSSILICVSLTVQWTAFFRLLRWICETVRASSAANGSASSLALSQSWAR